MALAAPQALRDRAREQLSHHLTGLFRLSEALHKNPETAFKEFKAAAWCAEFLKKAGFQVKKEVYGLKTAFEARQGEGRFVIAVCAEYDALPDVGHACGHNLIAASSLGAAVALSPFTKELGFCLKVLGTPAEEGGGGKIIMMERGAFAGVDLAMMAHPATVDAVSMKCKALSQLEVVYEGKEAHASGAPHLGINALDAQVVAHVAISALRQHLPPGQQVHGIITKGGDAPNVVPARTCARYIVRADTERELKALKKRVIDCFKAGALATGCKLSITQPAPDYSEFRHRRDFAEMLVDVGAHLPRPRRLESDEKNWFVASTDMANVSKKVPSIHPTFRIECSASPHQKDFASACTGQSVKDAIEDASLLLAYFGLEWLFRKAGKSF